MSFVICVSKNKSFVDFPNEGDTMANHYRQFGLLEDHTMSHYLHNNIKHKRMNSEPL